MANLLDEYRGSGIKGDPIVLDTPPGSPAPNELTRPAPPRLSSKRPAPPDHPSPQRPGSPSSGKSDKRPAAAATSSGKLNSIDPPYLLLPILDRGNLNNVLYATHVDATLSVRLRRLSGCSTIMQLIKVMEQPQPTRVNVPFIQPTDIHGEASHKMGNTRFDTSGYDRFRWPRMRHDGRYEGTLTGEWVREATNRSTEFERLNEEIKRTFLVDDDCRNANIVWHVMLVQPYAPAQLPHVDNDDHSCYWTIIVALTEDVEDAGGTVFLLEDDTRVIVNDYNKMVAFRGNVDHYGASNMSPNVRAFLYAVVQTFPDRNDGSAARDAIAKDQAQPASSSYNH